MLLPSGISRTPYDGTLLRFRAQNAVLHKALQHAQFLGVAVAVEQANFLRDGLGIFPLGADVRTEEQVLLFVIGGAQWKMSACSGCIACRSVQCCSCWGFAATVWARK